MRAVLELTFTPALAALLHKHHGWVTWEWHNRSGERMPTYIQSTNDEGEALRVFKDGKRTETIIYHGDDIDEVYCARVLHECALRVLRNHFPSDEPISTLSRALLVKTVGKLGEFLDLPVIDRVAALV